jgi:hypothetical protein
MTKVRPQLLCAAVAVAVALAGCGGDDETPAGTNLNAILCPMEATGKEVSGVPQYRPAADAFDTSELIGQSLEDAGATAGDHGCHLEVSKQDGAGVPVPTDIDPTRIYVFTEDDVVTEIEGVGGGL